jgi:carbamoyltransferase
MVKKREAYRPFAPSVLEEYVEDYYDIPFKHPQFPYMIFVVKVKKKVQELLGAVTHVDGTARIQTVSRETNPRYWELIDEFRKITGVPIVLNTSFNNNAEPIVDSVTDAIVCFYTTTLNYLVIGDYLIHKKDVPFHEHLNLVPSLPVYNMLTQTNKFVSLDELRRIYEIKNNFDNGYRTSISPEVFRILNEVDGCMSVTLGDLMEQIGITDEERRKAIIDEIRELWVKRFIRLQPNGVSE